ncbi:hypothetical protein GCM10017687_27260 [Streptomyces echinatus]
MLPATRVKQLAQSIDLVVEAVHTSPVDQYHSPTPCSAWTVKDLVNHIAMMLLMTRDAGTRTASDPSLLTANPVPLLAGRPESEWALLVAGSAEPAARAWSEPAAWEGEASLGEARMPATALGGILIAECAVHAWDTAAATGQRLTIPASLAEATFATYSREAPRMRSLGLLGTQHGVRQGPGADLVVTDADGRSDAEGPPGPPCGLAGAAETASKAVADSCVSRCVRGLAEHGTRETGGGVVGNVHVERKVAATASSTRGKQA